MRLPLFVCLATLVGCSGLKLATETSDAGDPNDATPPAADDAGDASPPPDVVDASDAATVHYVFVSTAKSNGAFAGTADPYAFADSTCQTEADAVSLGGTYVAWLSYQQGTGTAHNARDRVPNVAYSMPGDRLEAGAPIPIASSLGDLLANGPSQPLDRLANGTQVPADENSYVAWAWTGTKGDGTVDSQTCTSWTVSASTSSGIAGNARQIPQFTVTDWTTLGGRTCDVPRRFYCFQK